MELDNLQLADAAARFQSTDATARAAAQPVAEVLLSIRDRWRALTESLQHGKDAYPGQREARKYARAADALHKKLTAIASRIPALPPV